MKQLFLAVFLSCYLNAGMTSSVDGEMLAATQILKTEVETAFNGFKTQFEQIKSIATSIKEKRERENDLTKSIQAADIEQEIIWAKIDHKLGIEVLNESE